MGFALQDTLGNLFAGIGIQIDRPFRVGQWVAVGSHEGVVTAVTWRATKIRTKLGNLVILPNNLTAKEAITNYSEPVPTRLIVDVGAASDVPPNEVRDAMMAVLAQARHVLETPPPDVLLYDFGPSANMYRARFWVADFNLDEDAKDSVRRGIFYEFKRRGIEIPWPIQVRYNREEPRHDTPERRATFARAIAGVPVLAPLADEVHQALAAAADDHLYGDGEVIVREGNAGSSMFVVESGHVVVTVGRTGAGESPASPRGATSARCRCSRARRARRRSRRKATARSSRSMRMPSGPMCAIIPRWWSPWPRPPTRGAGNSTRPEPQPRPSADPRPCRSRIGSGSSSDCRRRFARAHCVQTSTRSPLIVT